MKQLAPGVWRLKELPLPVIPKFERFVAAIPA
jgi:hypothetical protein